MRFEQIVNQDAVKKILIRTALRQQLPNGYLLYGPEGVGKWAMALALTAFLNCKNPTENDSCGECGPCRQIAKLQFLNLFIAVPTPPSKSEKDELENYWTLLKQKIEEPYSLLTGSRTMLIPVQTVRDIRRSLAQKPPLAGYRVVIIEQMDRMLTNSADALLKLIEEPPPRTLIIITCSHPEKLLPTVISRCRKVRLGTLSEDMIVGYLRDNYDIKETKAKLLTRLSGGSLGRALYLADDEHAQDRDLSRAVLKGLFQASASTVMAEVHDLMPFNDRSRMNRILASWQYLFRDLILLSNGAGADKLINTDFAPEMEKMTAGIRNSESFLAIPNYLGTVMRDIELNVDTRMAVTAALLKIEKRLRV